jgi:penicillin-insensitive murein endopeptidase
MLKCLLITLFILHPCLVTAGNSTCYGTTANGRIENAAQLPGSGVNFTSYGSLPELSGRTYVHSIVAKVVVDAYQSLAISHPDKVFKFAETGFKNGGQFKPHKTHQNGLSIDFMVPVIDKDGKSTHFPTTVFNKYGYDVEFDQNGKFEDFRIDFEALGAHIVALHKASRNNGINIWRVLFAPDLQPKLYATQDGEYIKKHILIPTKKSWVRHDEHYHVDFDVTCNPLN